MLICACEAKVKNGFVKKMMDGHTIMLMTKNKQDGKKLMEIGIIFMKLNLLMEKEKDWAL